ncbi:MAG: ATP-dependent RNA helicase HrpA [Desulfobulbus propionicus]|nr:MAG: ATP-dependent RNA helicase HrpA [Desulfobulbus propionicus]
MRLTYPKQLPISACREEIVTAIRQHRVLIVAGDTGSGKTTQLPKMCIEGGRGTAGRLIGCTQPRRIAAISVSERVAEETNAPDAVSYAIRFKDTTADTTRIRFMTDGVLLAEIQSDRMLNRYDTLIIDEAHERSLNIDFLLGYLKELLAQRPDLQLIISSATIDTDKFSKYFNAAPVLSIPGRLHPITLEYRDVLEDEDDNYVRKAVETVLDICARPGGDILVFMPSEQDIRETLGSLNGQLDERHLLLPLYGRLSGREQRRIFAPDSRRRIIVATNVAETSITVPGIRFVVDTGRARIARYNVRARTSSLQIGRISQASCDQRRGRCGRTGPGTCIRLYSEEDYLSRAEHTVPEIQRSNLAEVILRMISLRLGDPLCFPFIDQPGSRAIRDGFQILRELGALDQHDQLTAHGRLMARLPLDPTISRIIIEGIVQGALRETLVIAAALSLQDPRIRPPEQEGRADEAHRHFTDSRSDFLTLLAIWDSLHEGEEQVGAARLGRFCKKNFLSWQRMREWQDVHGQLKRILRQRKQLKINTEPASYAAVHMAITAGFLRNIAQKKEKNLYQAGGGREVWLFPGSGCYNRGGKWIIAANFVATSQLFARLAATIEPGWLEPLAGRLCTYSWSDPHWEKRAGQVIAKEQVSLFGLVIVAGRRVNYGRINRTTREEAREIFIRQALICGDLSGRYPFLEHNLGLVKELGELEDRLRRRTLLVDDEKLYAFYHERLPGVYDRFTLNRLLRKRRNHGLLFMERDQLCQQAPRQEELYRFPATLKTAGIELQLSYRFEPGSDDDGVTVHIPEPLLPLLSPALFEWLVPGLLEEKVLFLCKRLPKQIRRRLVPLPAAVDRLLDSLDLYRGSLYTALDKSLLRAYQVTVSAEQWRVDELPLHLRMRFQLMDGDRIVQSSRSFSALLARHRPGREQPTETPLPERYGITTWEFDGLPPRIAMRDAQGRSQAVYFPCLAIDAGQRCVHLTYTSDEEQSRQATRQGLQFLYSLEHGREMQQLRKQCKQIIRDYSASWLALGLSVKASKLIEQLQSFVLTPVLDTAAGTLPTQKEFARVHKRLNSDGLLRSATVHLQQIVTVLQCRREAQSRINTWETRTRTSRTYAPKLHQAFQASLEQILPGDFLHSRDAKALQDVPRYLKALSVRIERAEQNPHKDALKADRLTWSLTQLGQLEKFPSSGRHCLEAAALFRQMVEEFRVAVFAPELGTTMKVSEKRLIRQWQEVERHCRSLEQT